MNSFLLILSVVFAVAASECPAPRPASDPECPARVPCCHWNLKYNNASIYDTSLEFAENVLCRPLGYAFATWFYQSDGIIPQPCAQLTCTSDPCWIVIAIETSPPSSLCVRGNQGGQPTCGQGSFSACFRMRSTTVQYSFYCETGCGESNVDFWYRLTTFTPQPGQDGNDICQDMAVEYPSSLAQLPDIRDPQFNNPIETVPQGSSAVQTIPVLSVSVAALLLYLFM